MTGCKAYNAVMCKYEAGTQTTDVCIDCITQPGKCTLHVTAAYTDALRCTLTQVIVYTYCHYTYTVHCIANVILNCTISSNIALK